jgi:hypothetical protein
MPQHFVGNAHPPASLAMFGPLGQEFLSCGSMMALGPESLSHSGVRCWPFFLPLLTRETRLKILKSRRISLLTSRRMMMMMEMKTAPYVVAEFLVTSEKMAAYLEACLKTQAGLLPSLPGY